MLSQDHKLLYEEVVALLRNQLEQQQWKPGEQLPSEAELSAAFGVSRSTIREAVLCLVEEGVLIKKRGRGTFVNAPVSIHAGLETLMSVTEWIEQSGFRAGTADYEIGFRPASPQEIRLFKEEQEHVVGVIHRVRTKDDLPCAYCEDILPVRLAPTASEEMGTSLFAFLEQQRGERITLAQSKVKVETASTQIQEALHLSGPEPLLVLEQVHFDEHRKPVLLSKDCFIPNKFNFNLVRKRRLSGGSRRDTQRREVRTDETF